MAAVNYASIDMGAEIADVSTQGPSQLSSGPQNLLLDREDLLWMTADAPQHVTIRIKDNHPPIRYIGWHVWQDYVTNPQTVIVSSGTEPKTNKNAVLSNFVLECTALPGAGTQLWELPTPIPSSHCYIQFKITATFAPGPTYMNKLVLYSSHPGTGFHTRSGDATPNTSLHHPPPQSTSYQQQNTSSGSRNHRQGSSTPRHNQQNSSAHQSPYNNSGHRAGSLQMSDLLAGLDDDIKRLHPIKTISPTKRPSASNGRSISPSVMLPDATYNPGAYGEEGQQQMVIPQPPPQIQYVQLPAPPADPSGQEALMRVKALERSVELLTKAVERQSDDISEMRRLLVEQSIQQQRREEEERARSTSASAVGTGATRAAAGQSEATTMPSVTHPTSSLQLIEFPETALKNYIEDVLAPRLAKHAKRSEAKSIQQIDDHMHVLLKEIGSVVDERVERHLHKIMRDARNPYAKAFAIQQQQHYNGPLTSLPPPPPHAPPHNSYQQHLNQSNQPYPSHGAGGGGAYHTYEELYGHGGNRSRSAANRGTRL